MGSNREIADRILELTNDEGAINYRLADKIQEALDELEARKDAEAKEFRLKVKANLVEIEDAVAQKHAEVKELVEAATAVQFASGLTPWLALQEALKPFQKNPLSGSEKEKPNANG